MLPQALPLWYRASMSANTNHPNLPKSPGRSVVAGSHEPCFINHKLGKICHKIRFVINFLPSSYAFLIQEELLFPGYGEGREAKIFTLSCLPWQTMLLFSEPLVLMMERSFKCVHMCLFAPFPRVEAEQQVIFQT